MHRSNDEFYSISVEDSKLKIEILFNHACYPCHFSIINIVFLSLKTIFDKFFIVKVSGILVPMFRCYFFLFNMKNLYPQCKNSKIRTESIFQVTIEFHAGFFIKNMPSVISLLCKQN